MPWWTRFLKSGQAKRRQNQGASAPDRQSAQKNDSQTRVTRSAIESRETGALCVHPESESQAANQELDHRRNRRPLWVAAGITFVYALFAGLQWQTMRQQLELSERAWLAPEYIDFQPSNVWQVGNPIYFTLHYENTGREPALNLRRPNISVAMVTLKDGWRNFDFPENKVCESTKETRGGRSIFANVKGFYFENFHSPNLIDEAFLQGKSGFIVEGCLVYDTLGAERHSAYCFYLDVEDRQFHPCPNGNYAD